MADRKKRVFSGIQPSGNLHIGNYLGAIRNWVASLDEYDNIFCIVDLHALTVDPEERAAELHANTMQLAALYVACGLDPQKCALFVQSHLHEHAELTWMLGCVTPTGWLNRMTQFKSKAGEHQEQASTGLYTYPVLMAADILLYQADAVPVGDDQRQHVELTRDIAERFNYLFGPTFTVPEPLIREVGARIMSLDDPTKKMSKSEPGSYIALLDPPEVIRKKVGRATTDSERSICFDEKRPGVYNLLTIYELLTGQTRPAIEAHFENKGYKELKSEVAEAVIAELEPIQQRYHALMADPTQVTAILDDGAARLRPLAQETLRTAMTRMGLRS
ncbi:MAG TPA: tryptophan--tRNA ligase [Ktedonobacterales bacterium]|nr:tryptophan--tRNA ligase [Ktedonobacterales bacterium]